MDAAQDSFARALELDRSTCYVTRAFDSFEVTGMGFATVPEAYKAKAEKMK